MTGLNHRYLLPQVEMALPYPNAQPWYMHTASVDRFASERVNLMRHRGYLHESDIVVEPTNNTIAIVNSPLIIQPAIPTSYYLNLRPPNYPIETLRGIGMPTELDSVILGIERHINDHHAMVNFNTAELADITVRWMRNAISRPITHTLRVKHDCSFHLLGWGHVDEFDIVRPSLRKTLGNMPHGQGINYVFTPSIVGHDFPTGFSWMQQIYQGAYTAAFVNLLAIINSGFRPDNLVALAEGVASAFRQTMYSESDLWYRFNSERPLDLIRQSLQTQEVTINQAADDNQDVKFTIPGMVGIATMTKLFSSAFTSHDITMFLGTGQDPNNVATRWLVLAGILLATMPRLPLPTPEIHVRGYHDSLDESMSHILGHEAPSISNGNAPPTFYQLTTEITPRAGHFPIPMLTNQIDLTDEDYHGDNPAIDVLHPFQPYQISNVPSDYSQYQHFRMDQRGVNGNFDWGSTWFLSPRHDSFVGELASEAGQFARVYLVRNSGVDRAHTLLFIKNILSDYNTWVGLDPIRFNTKGKDNFFCLYRADPSLIAQVNKTIGQGYKKLKTVWKDYFKWENDDENDAQDDSEGEPDVENEKEDEG